MKHKHAIAVEQDMKPVKPRLSVCEKRKSAQPDMFQGSKQPSKVTALAELLRLKENAGTAEISRDYFRANSRIGDKWNLYWPSFKAFLAAASDDNDLFYEALVELTTEK